MQIVINISKDDLNAIKYLKVKGWASRHELLILNGTPLPKGHGKIMDVDKIIKRMEEREEQLKDNRSMYETACVETALDMFGETIIPADKEGD